MEVDCIVCAFLVVVLEVLLFLVLMIEVGLVTGLVDSVVLVDVGGDRSSLLVSMLSCRQDLIWLWCAHSCLRCVSISLWNFV